MEFFFPEDHLQRMTPEETRITSLKVEPYLDGVRLRVDLEMTPFQKRPHLDLLLFDSADQEVVSTNIVEPLSWKLELTMHLPAAIAANNPLLRNPYTLKASLYYPEGPSAEPRTYTFEIPSAENGN